MICCALTRTVRAVGEMNNDVDTVEMPRPVGRGADISDRAKLDARDWFGRTAGAPVHGVAAFDKPDAQRAADKAGRTGHQDASQSPPSARSPRRLSNRSRRRWIREIQMPIPPSGVSTWPYPLSQNR